jgi:two-component system sensor histidine kinase HydH|nr:ATP-binding protein [Kofleriaceae bacterium]
MLARPLAGWSVVAAFALIGVAVLATAWSTRSTIVDATEAVRAGETLAVEQAVRADLADLGGLPGDADLRAILAARTEDGIRYLAVTDRRRGLVASAGTPVLETGGKEREMGPRRAMRRVVEGNGRVRIELRTNFRRWGDSGGAQPSIVIEVEAVEAEHMREAADRSVGIGTIAALVLLGVAIVLVRAELRRQADERRRERERRLASLGEMSAVLAHEIKNPLASLKGNAQLLVAMLPEAAGDKRHSKAQRVVDEALRLEQLTTDLLAFVRTGELARAPADPAAIARDAVGDQPNVTVDTHAAPATWSLDAARLREVIVNLVDNAVAAGPPVTVTVGVVGRDGRQLAIDVADTGPGVPEAERDKIFEPFHTGKVQGTGLGLAVARRVVEAHGGTIQVGRAPNGGALFRVVIPA